MSKSYLRQTNARSELDEIWKHPEFVNVIHYSCESFYDRPDGTSPRITSIAVRSLKTGQTQSFSIHKFGELKGVAAKELNEQYNLLEKEMLDEFFNLVNERKEYKWVHWNMRDENYGFHALELRHRILKGTPTVITDEKKFDLAKILTGIYGKSYIGHPRLEKLIQKNEISNPRFATGKEEADYFKDGNYVGLHQSTLSKVDIFSSICQLAYEAKLSTDATWWDIHGQSLKAFMAWFSNHPFITFTITVVSLLANLFFITQLFF